MAQETAEQRNTRLRATGLKWIRLNYLVPARRGGRVRFTGGAEPRHGSITSAQGARLRVRFDGDKRPSTLHPTWCIEYIAAPHTH